MSMVTNNTVRMVVTANGNVGIGSSNPQQRLDINGAVRIGHTSNAFPGTIRFNSANNDFEGYDGARWRSLTSNANGVPQQSDTSETAAAGEMMGQSVKFLEPYVFVGVPGDDIGANADQGSVKIFRKNAFTGYYELLQTLTAAGGATGDAFGSSLDACIFARNDSECSFKTGRTTKTVYLVVSAPKKDYPSKTDQGAVYLFCFNIEQNQFVQQGNDITPADGAAGDGFGSAICMKEGSDPPGFFASSPLKTIGTNFGQGKCYLFEMFGSDCSGVYLYFQNAIINQSFTLATGAAFDFFGGSLAYSPTFGDGSFKEALAVGCTRRTINGQTNQGAVYVYATPGAGNITLPLYKELIASDGNANDFFGTSVAFDTRVPNLGIVVGCPGKENGAISRQGAIYAFGINFSNNQLEQFSKIVSSTGSANDDFGTSVAFGPQGVLMVSCPGDDEGGTDAGAVFAYEPGANPRQPIFYRRAKLSGVGPQANSKLATAISIDQTARKYVLGIPNWDIPGKIDAGKIIIGDIFN
ncbi:MAG: FG-GAP repeat protein [Chitinophagaceae bacterium]|nr:FG-GAP repeat protein [Chitinophagaceae bacterium]